MSCAGLTNEQLLAEIAEYRAAIKTATIGGGVGVVAGEGRRVEFVGTNVSEARTELRNLIYEAEKRGLMDSQTRGAIAVEIG